MSWRHIWRHICGPFVKLSAIGAPSPAFGPQKTVCADVKSHTLRAASSTVSAI